MNTTKQFIDDLIQEVPSLVPLQTAHTAEFSEMLPHVFFGDLTRHVLHLYSDFGGADTTLRQILLYLERGFAQGGEEVRN
jgi:hypothetical protein